MTEAATKGSEFPWDSDPTRMVKVPDGLKPSVQPDDNSRYITGEWYEMEYSHGWYRKMYIEGVMPTHAIEAYRYNVDMTIALTGLNRDAKILDLGAGVGNLMRAWKSRGFFNVSGIEISPTAVKESGNPNIKCGSIADMSMFKDKQFDVVTSTALLEHIDVSQEAQAVQEAVRVGHRQAHFIGLERGLDPGHINIKTIDEWAALFTRYFPGMTAVIPDDVSGDPILLCVPENMLIHPMRRCVKWPLQIQAKGEITL